MPRNIAERAGEWKPKEKAKFFRYAKRSADECAATLDTMVDYDMLREEDIKHAKELLARIIPMLIRLIKLFEEGRGAVEARTRHGHWHGNWTRGSGTCTRHVTRARHCQLRNASINSSLVMSL